MSKQKKPSNGMKQIDENLRRVYNEAEREEIPDRLKQLLARLRSQDNTDE